MQPLSVLLIDDNETDRFITKSLLTIAMPDTDFEIFEKNDGQEALDFFYEYEKNKRKYNKNYPPQLIFLDINMPIMNGFEFLEQFSKITSHLEYQQSSVFILSASDNTFDIEKSYGFKCVREYIHKFPLSAMELNQTLTKYLDN